MTEEAGKTNKIEVKSLTKRFGDLLVLDVISFNVAKGEFLSIVGPTGCGKTTFLNCLSKLTPTTEGNIFIDGEVADPRKHNISFVFQEPTCLPWRTVRENVAYGMEVKHAPRESRHPQAGHGLDPVVVKETLMSKRSCKMKKIVFFGVLVLTARLVFSLTPGQVQAPMKLKTCWMPGFETFLPWLAKQKGWDKQEGLDLEVVKQMDQASAVAAFEKGVGDVAVVWAPYCYTMEASPTPTRMGPPSSAMHG